jgi:hypothetical protein
MTDTRQNPLLRGRALEPFAVAFDAAGHLAVTDTGPKAAGAEGIVAW